MTADRCWPHRAVRAVGGTPRARAGGRHVEGEGLLRPQLVLEDVLAFDAVDEYGLPDFEDLVEYFEGNYRSGQAVHPHLVFPGGYYRTIVSGCIEAFGWEAGGDRNWRQS